jgi:hypothetical protein
MVRYYTRPIDAGNGRQNVVVKDGVVVKQYLVARSGYYTGSGYPELVGQPASRLRQLGFERVSGPQVFDSFRGRWVSMKVEEESELN